MKRTFAFLAAIAFCAAGSAVFAEWVFSNEGTWPKSWPEELEPLRKQSRSFEGPEPHQRHDDIAFTHREDFESAWPHVLKVKSKGAPVILVRGPNRLAGTPINAGVRIHSPPAQTDKRVHPEKPLAGAGTARERWMLATYIELVVDGDIVDLNRIPLPADTPIIDERFPDEQKESPKPGGG